MRIFAKICVWAPVSNYSVLQHYLHSSLEMKNWIQFGTVTYLSLGYSSAQAPLAWNASFLKLTGFTCMVPLHRAEAASTLLTLYA